jgi:hypothetical protein
MSWLKTDRKTTGDSFAGKWLYLLGYAFKAGLPG